MILDNNTSFLQTAIASAISTAKSNIEWATKRGTQMNEYFDSSNVENPVLPSLTPSKGGNIQPLIATMILSIVSVMLLLIVSSE